ncbi:hypothetical protein RRG08_003799 [Elysia crispata]|uniref:Chitin-binding type-2 domain-containing protein n=1 Tax=Elysia crispata TaxID=231223 RepID=A0AAE1E574_9GAST|nr:hypothetical protein RRG08_003799 [Elysia crispata]
MCTTLSRPVLQAQEHLFRKWSKLVLVAVTTGRHSYMLAEKQTRMGSLATLLLTALILPGVAAQDGVQEDQAACMEGEIIHTGICSSEYKTCEGGRWNAAICAVGIFDGDTKTCVPSSPKCPEITRKKRSLRKKRQAQSVGLTDCSVSFMCPADLRRQFVYPYWSSCDSYVLCESGRLSLVSCKFRDYNYYNPRKLSCEQFASESNTCVFRLNTDLSPLALGK